MRYFRTLCAAVACIAWSAKAMSSHGHGTDRKSHASIHPQAIFRWPVCHLEELPSPIILPDHDATIALQSTFLSFEDWKAKNMASIKHIPSSTIADDPIYRHTETPSHRAELKVLNQDVQTSTTVTSASFVAESTPVTSKNDIRSPKKERFNHASFDCAASVILTNPEAKGASNILKANKDQYMLNTCNAASKFVVVELCNDILVDTVQMANYEYFSGVFRNVTVEVSAKYPPGKEGWQELGAFRARHSRETQTFTFDNPIIWARYIRVSMSSFFGNEFYCPL